MDIQGVDIVHDHGIWLLSNHAAARSARKARIPFVVSPRGMLEPWSLSQKRLKKQLAWALYQRRDLSEATAFHVTSEAEAAAIRAAGLNAPVAVIPNGVDLPDVLAPRSTGNPRRALFLSRIHPKKGLSSLVKAWAQVRPLGWELAIAGPDENGHRAELETLVQTLSLSDSVQFVGPVSDEAKWALYRSAELFVLPTHSENFGLVVAEALGAGVPVLTTTGAPWRVLGTERCGWWTDITVDALAAALTEAAALPPERLVAMGERGRTLVQKQYGWEGAARQMKAVYEWILGTGDLPACLSLS